MFAIIVELFVLLASVSSRKCDKDFDIRLNTVILTRISENNGAALNHKLSADSLVECVKYCCDTIECTVGVFGPKVLLFLSSNTSHIITDHTVLMLFAA